MPYSLSDEKNCAAFLKSIENDKLGTGIVPGTV